MKIYYARGYVVKLNEIYGGKVLFDNRPSWREIPELNIGKI